jgi:hypothetical protein
VLVVSRSAEEASEDYDNCRANDGEPDDGEALAGFFVFRDNDLRWLFGLVVIAGTQGQDDPGYWQQQEFLQAVSGEAAG